MSISDAAYFRGFARYDKKHEEAGSEGKKTDDRKAIESASDAPARAIKDWDAKNPDVARLLSMPAVTPNTLQREREAPRVDAAKIATAHAMQHMVPQIPQCELPAWGELEKSLEAKPDQGQAAPAKPKRETQADRIEKVAAECERRAEALGEPFDRQRMPGQKGDFLELLHLHDSKLSSIKTPESLDNYLGAVGCRWPLEASASKSARPLYARLFPELYKVPGVVLQQRMKA